MTDISQSKLWGGRFSEATDAFVERFTASVSFDKRLAPYDIQGSIAHAEMLAKVGVLSIQEAKQITEGLSAILHDIQTGQFKWSVALEDVHMNIESALTQRIGEVGKKLHTARSRNDQVATDMRLYLRDASKAVIESTGVSLQALAALAEQEAATIMPGYTHLQTAQPITFGHHLLAWFEMLYRDVERLQEGLKRINIMPLGSAALAGTTYPIDREMTANALGFLAPSRNSLDAVSDRDFIVEFTANAAMLMMHLSRISEELILWTSAHFDFIELPDRFCTGSSIMPQKKNPDVPELIRGKSGRVYGALMSLLTLMKSQPLAYNKDNQEDKEPLFDTVDTLLDVLKAFGDMVPALKAKKERMYQAALLGYATATDLADYLVKRGIPFREAHEIVGQVVRHCIDNRCQLESLALDVLQQLSPVIQEDVFDVLTLEGSVNARDHVGGTAPKQVKHAAAEAGRRVNHLLDVINA